MSPYVDATTGVPFNKLGITDRSQLKAVEYGITNQRIAQLNAFPISGEFDLDHLRRIHKHIFQDVFAWAGQQRTLNFSKRDPGKPWWKSVFARHDHIPMIAQSISTDLHHWNQLKGIAPAEFATKAAAVYIKLNHMHPFPEGNGRSTQVFMAQLAKEAGYTIDYRKVDPVEWNRAAARSMPQVSTLEPGTTRKADPRLIQAVFERIVEPTRAMHVELARQADKGSRGRDSGPER